MLQRLRSVWSVLLITATVIANGLLRPPTRRRE